MDLAQRISKLSPEQIIRFESKLRQQDLQIDVLHIPITKEYRNNDESLPLSFEQERLWFIHQLEPHNTAYNLIRATKLEGNLDKQALERSIKEIVRRHDILRTHFVFDKKKPAQIIRDELSLPLEIIDLKHLPKEKQEDDVLQLIQGESQISFDLSRGPLLRTTLLELSSIEHVFLLVIHHIISDGTSVQVFIRELGHFYQVFSGGEKSSAAFPGLSVQYVDYACWQRRWFGEDAVEIGSRKRQETYWLEQFSGEIPVLTLPCDYKRPVIQDFEGSVTVFSLNSEESTALKEMALGKKTTLYVVLLTIYNIFLSKLSGMEDIVVGTPVAGRRHPDIQEIIGMFVNTLALRNYPRFNTTFKNFLEEVKDRTLNAFENQEYRYEDIVGKVNVSRDTSRNPLFDVMFLLKNVDYAEINIPGLTLKRYEYEKKASKFDLTLSAWEESHTLHFSFEYCTKLFKQQTIARFADYFKGLIRSVVQDPGVVIAVLEMVPEGEKRKLLYDFNDTEVEFPKDKTLHRLFEEQVEKLPGHIASVFENKKLSYNQLNERCNHLARHLRSKGVKGGTIVGIFADRSLELMTAIFAVLKAGGMYLPLDPNHPPKRIKYMLKASDTELVVTNTGNRLAAEDEFIFVDLNNVAAGGDSTIANLEPLSFAEDPAYVIYTSGTTGIPKGVVIEHRSAANFIKGMTDIIDFRTVDTILSLTTLSFDIFGLETIVPLVRGSMVVMGSSREQMDPAAAASVIERERVTILQVTPSRLQLFLSHDKAKAGKSLKLLRYLLVGGETFPGKLLEHVRPLVTGNIFNLYGPTETTIWSTAKDVTADPLLNIGRPIANTRVYILNKIGRPQPIGVPGELFIGGKGVGRGYLNNQELTAEKFVFYHEGHEGTRRFNVFYMSHMSSMSYIYKTGDLARWLADGTIDFLGRTDHQVKIRGFRIELEEIENRLMDHDAVKEAVVIAKENKKSDKFLCAYYVPVDENGDNADLQLDVQELREFLSVHLPDYMIPSYFAPLKRIPLTPNKKIDRNALPDHDGTRPKMGTAYLAPQTGLEKKIADHWLEVLNVDHVGIHDNFFQLGGNSLNIIQLNTQLKETFGRDIPVVAMFRHLTVSSFARYIKESDDEARIAAEENQRQKVESLRRTRKLFKDKIRKPKRRNNGRKN